MRTYNILYEKKTDIVNQINEFAERFYQLELINFQKNI